MSKVIKYHWLEIMKDVVVVHAKSNLFYHEIRRGREKSGGRKKDILKEHSLCLHGY